LKPQRIIGAVGALAAFLLVLTLVTMAVGALDTGWAIAALFALVVGTSAAVRLLRRRVARGTVIEIDLDGGVVERSGSDPVSRAMTRNAVEVRNVVDALRRSVDDPRVVGAVVRLGNGGIDLGHAQEIREAVHEFRKSGKPAVAFAEAFGEGGRATTDYYLAAAFDQIYLQPGGIASVEGVLARGTFLRGVFDKFGFIPDFDHRKEYKAAKYMFTETGFTEPHKEALGAVAEDRFNQIVTGIAIDRGLDRESVVGLIDTAPLTAEAALRAGLVDHLGYRDEAYAAAGVPGSGFVYHDRYLKKAGRPHRRGKRIALIYGTGSISRGGSRFDPLTRGASLGADDVARAFRQAVDDDRVEAIVFRVDSPGGSAVASVVIGHELDRAREAGKPVVVSMANVAGSGGYWISVGADRIVAQPGTITGSIGVVWGKLANRGAWARLGVTFDEILFGENATFGSAQDVFSETERARLDILIDDVYDNFVARVALGRGLTLEQVEGLAKGRIWTGAQAQERGLVDELGGLERAIALARSLARIESSKPVRVTVYPRDRGLPIRRGKDSSEPIRQAVAAVVDVIESLGHTESVVRARLPLIRF
jgi:protease-4